MTHARLVDILDARNDLLVDADSCLLMQALVLHDIIKEFSILAVLHHQVQFCLCLYNLPRLIAR